MTVFKHRKGFLLIEAVFALCIAAAVLAPLHKSLTSFVGKIVLYTNQVTMLYEAKQFLYAQLAQIQYEDQKATEGYNKKEVITLVAPQSKSTILTIKDIHPASVFRQNAYLRVAKVHYEWHELFGTGSDTLIQFVPRIYGAVV